MKHGFFGRLLTSLLLIGAGVIFLLNLLGVVDLDLGELFRTYWPAILIYFGLIQFVNSGSGRGGFIGALVLVLVGGYLLARNMGYTVLSPREVIPFLIPVVLIAGGLHLLIKPRSREPRKPKAEVPPPPNPFDAPPAYHPEMESPLDSIFAEMEQKERAQKKQTTAGQKSGDSSHYYGHTAEDQGPVIQKSGFIGDVRVGQDYFQLAPMNISHFIGDTVIDLTKAQIPYGETHLNVSSFIGDVKIFVPDDMDIGIIVESSAFIGDLKLLNQKQGGFMSSLTVESPYYEEASKKVKLVVSVFVGDIKVNMVG
ncbi:cell wall-active antibiotics response protein LiaF [Paenibacillus sanguinis]|uniref:cell wall-active antibiotics response protein LiaF n=1 Tax=Paenibacillus sanguinis TaxID=225906 RepID=UPI0003821DB6|nr:cell wall-active antibiotics response protein LiaF [Paenibacillus sanguinis]